MTFTYQYDSGADTGNTGSNGSKIYKSLFCNADITAAKIYSVIYVLDGGEPGENSPSSHTYGTETTLIASTKSGYDFGGWYLENTFENKVETLSADGYSDDIILYAKWAEDEIQEPSDDKKTIINRQQMNGKILLQM